MGACAIVCAGCGSSSEGAPGAAGSAGSHGPTMTTGQAGARGSEPTGPAGAAGGDIEDAGGNEVRAVSDVRASDVTSSGDTDRVPDDAAPATAPGIVTTAPEGRRGIHFAVTGGALRLSDFGSGNPIIYDNDWWNDIIDSAYLLAQNSLGKADLQGLVVSRDFFGRPNYVQTLAAGVDDAQRLVANARAAGLHHVPDVTIGAGTPLDKPASGKIDDTQITPTAGSNLILQIARRATPSRPLIVYVGGSATTTATAYLQDPTIADRMIVAMCDPYTYNAPDDWSIYVLAMRTRFVAYHFEYGTNALSQSMFDTLPQNALTAQMKSAQSNKLILDNQIGDGVLLVATFHPELLSGAQRYDIDRAWAFHKTSADPYGFLDVPRQNIDYAAEGRALIETLRDPAVYGGTP